MKKILFSMVCLMMVGIQSVKSQNTLVATLSHDSKTTQFYGSTALQAAHDAAEDGDVITLSEGIFNELLVSKPIIIRGAGMRGDYINKTKATSVKSIRFGENIKNVKFEGLSILGALEDSTSNISDILFEKCLFKSWISPMSNCSMTFINCVVPNEPVYLQRENITLNFYNSFITYVSAKESSAMMIAENCIIGYMSGEIQYSMMKNCILYPRHDQFWPIEETASCEYCLGIDVFVEGDQNVFTNITYSSNQTIYKYDIFKTLRWDPEPITWYSVAKYTDTETFELTDEAAATYLGSDGTQVGMYGGKFPFTTTLSYPQFTKATVAKEAVDGKLNVNIEINAGN